MVKYVWVATFAVAIGAGPSVYFVSKVFADIAARLDSLPF